MSFPTGHIGINVTDLPRSRDFYADVFGLQTIGGCADGPQRFAFLGKGSEVVLTLWEQSTGTFDAHAPGLHHLSFQADTIDAVREAEQRLKSRRAKFVYDGIVPHAEGSESGGIFFEDPDGLRLEICAPAGAKGPAASEGPACGFF
jgi:catechol 2,3-dioxygenase-like lactoylglutathione lyase family enzyme